MQLVPDDPLDTFVPIGSLLKCLFFDDVGIFNMRVTLIDWPCIRGFSGVANVMGDNDYLLSCSSSA